MPPSGTGGVPAAKAGGGAIIGVPPSVDERGLCSGAVAVQLGGTDSGPTSADLPKPADSPFPTPSPDTPPPTGTGTAPPRPLAAASPNASPAAPAPPPALNK